MKLILRLIIVGVCTLLEASCSSEDKELQIPLEVSKSTLVVPQKGVTETISVTSSEAWKVACEADWVKCSPMSGQGSLDIGISVGANESENERSTTLSISTSTKTLKVAIVQSGLELTMMVSPLETEVNPSGQEFQIAVTDAGKDWEVEIPSSLQSWITLKSKEEKKAVFEAKLNNNGAERSGSLLFKDGKTSKTVKVTQDKFVSTVESKRWSDVATKQPDSWYATNEAKEVAENVLLYQKNCGGWYKNIEMHHLLTDQEKEALKATKSENACFDNGATTTELRFLAKMYKQVADKKYQEAFAKGVDYIIGAQYANGGWPQYYPLRGGYSDYITFNDNLVVNLLNLLRDVYQNKNEFTAIVESATSDKAKASFDKGVDCILKCQIVDGGVKTFWCAQHDQETLDPAVGRPHELPSFSGMEGAEIFEFLMTIEDPLQK